MIKSETFGLQLLFDVLENLLLSGFVVRSFLVVLEQGVFVHGWDDHAHLLDHRRGRQLPVGCLWNELPAYRLAHRRFEILDTFERVRKLIHLLR